MTTRISDSEIAGYCRTMATNFSLGIPLLQTLDTLAAEADGAWYDALVDIKSDVAEGMQLNFTMTRTGVFPDALISKVADGEKIGALDVVFDELATQYEKHV